jgi:hypothetical protein
LRTRRRVHLQVSMYARACPPACVCVCVCVRARVCVHLPPACAHPCVILRHGPTLATVGVQELESEQLDSQLLEPSPAPTTRIAAPQAAQPADALPNAPNKAIKAKPQKTAEELELEALEAEMAM